MESLGPWMVTVAGCILGMFTIVWTVEDMINTRRFVKINTYVYHVSEDSGEAQTHFRRQGKESCGNLNKAFVVKLVDTQP